MGELVSFEEEKLKRRLGYFVEKLCGAHFTEWQKMLADDMEEHLMSFVKLPWRSRSLLSILQKDD